MATLTLEYNARNRVASSIINMITTMDNLFKISVPVKTKSTNLTLKAMQDVENGNVVTCSSYEDYLKKTAKYA